VAKQKVIASFEYGICKLGGCNAENNNLEMVLDTA
jgi:hypothetical protein